MQLVFEDWEGRIGDKADIVAGELVPSQDGFLTVRESLAKYSVYVDRRTNSVALIIPKEDWRGREYRFRVQDCVVLTCLWMDDYCGSETLKHARSVGRAEYLKLNEDGYDHVLEAAGYVEQDRAPIHGDLLVYRDALHVGICLDGDKILHHLPLTLSCIDDLDLKQVIKVYRHAKAPN